jgi:hypothetical protein
MHQLSLPRALSTIVVVLSFLGGASAQSAETGGDLVVPQALQDMLRSHVPVQRPPNVLASLSAQQSIDHKGNFGRKVEVKIEFSMSRLENGLTGSQSSVVMDGGKGAGRGTGLSLCGLIGLLSDSQSSTETSTTTVIPIGKTFLPFAIKSGVDFSNRRRVVAIETNAPSLCNPTGGQEFTLKTEEELTVKTSGPFGRTNQIKRVQESKCRASADLKSASQIGASLEGDYREVQCDTVHEGGKTSSTRYAYLVASSFYLPIAEINEWQTAVITYPSVSYAKAE